MSRKEVDEDAIRAALVSQAGAIYDQSDVLHFLLDSDFYKHTGARFLCWMIQLRQIPATRSEWTSKLYELHNTFIEKQTSNIEQMVLSADDEEWIEKLIEQIGIQKHYVDDAKDRVNFIVSLVSKSVKYVPALNRCIWIMYIVSLFFATRGGLPKVFAQAMAFHLTSAFFDKMRLLQILKNESFMRDHFSPLDEILEREVPEMAEAMRHYGKTAYDWAMNWEITLFNDHIPYQVMFILDQIIARIDEMDTYIQFLCVAHMKQIQLPHGECNIIDVIRVYRDWNVEKVVEDARRMMDDQDMEVEENGCSCLDGLFAAIREVFSNFVQ